SFRAWSSLIPLRNNSLTTACSSLDTLAPVLRCAVRVSFRQSVKGCCCRSGGTNHSMGRSMDPEAPDLDLHESLSSEDRASALALVRDSVETFVREGRRLVPPPGSTLSRRQGPAFVTIALQGALRGCIGVLEP